MPRPTIRTVFVTFLGLGKYVEVVYPDPLRRDDIPPAPATPYVQEAFLHYLRQGGWHPEVLVFVTPQARAMHFDPPGALEDRLVASGFSVRPIRIEDPGAEESVWETFQKVVDAFEGGERVWFDVTHAFRILPMLGIVALNYARALKRVEIEGIWYGDFDPRADPPRRAASRDVTPLVGIQDWANATRALTEYGSVREMNALSSRTIDVFRARDSKAGRSVYSAFTELKRNLSAVAESLELANAHALLTDGAWTEMTGQLERLRSALEESQAPSAKPIVDLLHVVKESLGRGADLTHRPAAAVEWAAQHGLIPQGFTMLNELVITEVCTQLDQPPSDRGTRDFVSGYLKIPARSAFDPTRYRLPGGVDADDLLRSLAALPEIDTWRKLASKITEPRNALNHGGYDRTQGHTDTRGYAKQLGRALREFEQLRTL